MNFVPDGTIKYPIICADDGLAPTHICDTLPQWVSLFLINDIYVMGIFLVYESREMFPMPY